MALRTPFRLLAATATFSLLAITGHVQAATYTMTGDTTGAPTFNRPVQGLGSLSGVGTAVHYQTFSFSVDTSGSYSFTSLASPTWDNFLILYHTSFNPAAALSNAVIANDDSPSVGSSAFTTNLSSGTQYILVTTGFGNNHFGAYTDTITGPGNVVAVPEPESYALMGAGLGLLAWVSRRRQAKA
ncbi:hypothetical protein HNP55_002805 [Paucibacter oligotrophus]|uniref:Ice-binding protein C-terminal domain-containing protein n=1 Tax=Roseateles oligotrophus TaxID=1769250 RepID=A0A840LDX8_9BURK|nr:FxDxF family PEP-CTERM protein [Roseateles oligotrophus]MBB4844269.1 hypothetical protein [Roseateles oligotrophus]